MEINYELIWLEAVANADLGDKVIDLPDELSLYVKCGENDATLQVVAPKGSLEGITNVDDLVEKVEKLMEIKIASGVEMNCFEEVISTTLEAVQLSSMLNGFPND